MVTTIDTVTHQDDPEDRHAVVRFASDLLPGQSQAGVAIFDLTYGPVVSDWCLLSDDHAALSIFSLASGVVSTKVCIGVFP